MSKPKRAGEVFKSFRSDMRYLRAENELRANLTLANNILRLRLEQGMSQLQLAEAAGMRQPRIADLEGAKGNPGLDTIAKVAAAFQVPLARMFDADADPAPAYHVSTGHELSVGAVKYFQDETLNTAYKLAGVTPKKGQVFVLDDIAS